MLETADDVHDLNLIRTKPSNNAQTRPETQVHCQEVPKVRKGEFHMSGFLVHSGISLSSPLLSHSLARVEHSPQNSNCRSGQYVLPLLPNHCQAELHSASSGAAASTVLNACSMTPPSCCSSSSSSSSSSPPSQSQLDLHSRPHEQRCWELPCCAVLGQSR